MISKLFNNTGLRDEWEIPTNEGTPEWFTIKIKTIIASWSQNALQ